MNHQGTGNTEKIKTLNHQGTETTKKTLMKINPKNEGNSIDRYKASPVQDQIIEDRIGSQIVDAALKIHKQLGPGLLESAYQACLAFELRKRGIRVECEVDQPVEYDGMKIEVGYRLDLLVEGMVIVENKAVEKLLPVHEAQLLTYLKLRKCHIGYLINWHVPLIKDGIKRMAL
jgi:GxxExxY protein